MSSEEVIIKLSTKTKTIMKRIILSIKIAVLKYKMRRGIVTFSFKKADGTIREARGTLRRSLLPPTKGTGIKPSPLVFVYYDVEKCGWRSFRRENLL